MIHQLTVGARVHGCKQVLFAGWGTSLLGFSWVDARRHDLFCCFFFSEWGSQALGFSLVNADRHDLFTPLQDETSLSNSSLVNAKSHDFFCFSSLQDGVIGGLASDHSPSPCADKLLDEGNFLKAWGGISGITIVHYYDIVIHVLFSHSIPVFIPLHIHSFLHSFVHSHIHILVCSYSCSFVLSCMHHSSS